MSRPVSSGRKSWEPATGFDVVSALVLVILLTPFALATASNVTAGDGLPWIALATLLGLAASDFITGTLHWLCDTFFAEDTPIIGPAVIESFREHHRDQLAMTRRAFLRVSNSNVVATSLVLVLVWVARLVAPGPPSVFVDAWITTLACALTLTNQFHKWAHLPHVPRIVARLQALGLILGPAEHARHHRGNHSRAYCVTTGWLNPLLDGIHFFGASERVIEWIGRVLTWRPSGRRTTEP
jgi:ubiquitin-conjugating enzyme E2 variant